MKFVCEKSSLLKEVAIAQEIIGVKSTANALGDVYLEAANDTLLIKATDAMVYFETKVPISVVETGDATVKAALFLNILNSISEGEIEFEKLEGKVVIKPLTQKLKFELNINSIEYPEWPVSENAVSFDMDAKDFKEMISQTIFAVSNDETRLNMVGVYFEKSGDNFVMVSTDGRRLAFIQKPAGTSTDFPGIIIPEKALSIVLKHLSEEGSVSVSTNERNIFISFGAYSFCSSLIEGKFPDYKRVIPTDHDKSFTFNKSEMLDAVRHVSILVEKNSKRIYLKLLNGSISVMVTEKDAVGGSVDQEISSNYEGDEAQISLNYQYLEEPLKIMKDDEAAIYFKDTTKAVTLKPVPEKDFFHIIMPMQTDSYGY